MIRRAAALVACVALAGCPTDDMPPPTLPASPAPPTPSQRSTSPADDAPKGAATVTDDRASTTDRARLLAMTPDQALAEGLRGDAPGGLPPLLAGEAALAMAEQLRAADVPLEALDLCLVVFDRAREQTGAGQTVPAPVLEDLRRALEVQAGDLPALSRWVEALAGRVYLRRDLEGAVAFLVKVREVHALGAALPRPR